MGIFAILSSTCLPLLERDGWESTIVMRMGETIVLEILKIYMSFVF